MGVFGHPEAANLVYLGLYALQHRGQESCGIVSSDGKGLISHRADGSGRRRLQGRRHQTARRRQRHRPQPLLHHGPQPSQERPAASWSNMSQGPIAISHNGNLVNGARCATSWKRGLDLPIDRRHRGHRPSDRHVERSDIDGPRSSKRWRSCRGAYSLLFLTLDKLIAARDPLRFSPAGVGEIPEGKNRGAYVVASETCALDLIEAEYVREVEPGEIISVGPDGLESLKPFPPVAPCQVHLRIYLLCPARQQALRSQRLPSAQGVGTPVGAGKPRRCRPGDAGAGLRRAGGDGLCAKSRRFPSSSA